MDAPEYGALYTTKGVSLQGQVFESINEIFHHHYGWFEHKKAYVQIFVVKWHTACHY